MGATATIFRCFGEKMPFAGETLVDGAVTNGDTRLRPWTQSHPTNMNFAKTRTATLSVMP